MSFAKIGSNRHRAAEQHGKQIQRDDAEDDFILINKLETFDQTFDGNGFGGFHLVNMFDRHDEREASERSQGIQRINRPRRMILRGVRRERERRAERDRPDDGGKLKQRRC